MSKTTAIMLENTCLLGQNDPEDKQDFVRNTETKSRFFNIFLFDTPTIRINNKGAVYLVKAPPSPLLTKNKI
jgi:hypothetical protein